MKECDIWGAKCYSDPSYIFLGRSIPQPPGSTPVSVNRITRKQCCGLEFILSRSGSRSRDLMAKVSVLVSRPKKGLDNNTVEKLSTNFGWNFCDQQQPIRFWCWSAVSRSGSRNFQKEFSSLQNSAYRKNFAGWVLPWRKFELYECLLVCIFKMTRGGSSRKLWGRGWPLEGVDCRAPENTTAQSLTGFIEWGVKGDDSAYIDLRREMHRGGWGLGGVSFPSWVGLGGALWAPQAGSGSELRPQTPFQQLLSVTQRFRWK